MFASIVILIPALGIGTKTADTDTAIFSVVYRASLRPLPYTEADHITQISPSYKGQRFAAGVDPLISRRYE